MQTRGDFAAAPQPPLAEKATRDNSSKNRQNMQQKAKHGGTLQFEIAREALRTAAIELQRCTCADRQNPTQWFCICAMPQCNLAHHFRLIFAFSILFLSSLPR